MRAFVSVLAAMVVGACAAAQPGVAFPQETPTDLVELAEDTFERMVDAFPARAGCLDGVTVEGAWELDDRARYRADTATVTVRIPATAPQLEASLVHELAHHLEAACPDHAELRPALLESMGLASDHPWFDGPSWEETPSERFASAVVLHVLGRRDPGPLVAVTDETLAVVDDWATG